MENLIKRAIWLVGAVLVLSLVNVFVIKPISNMIDGNNFQTEVRGYLSEIEEPITESAFLWASQGLLREFSPEERTRLSERMRHLRNGGRTEFGLYDVDSWKRLHRDILDEAVWSARRKVEKTSGINVNSVQKNEWEAVLPATWKERYRLERLHDDTADLIWGNDDVSISELRQKFSSYRQEIDELMEQLKIKKAKRRQR